MIARLFVPVTIAAMLFVAPISSSCAVLQVPSGYATIQAAINAASNGDEIVVAPGVYSERVNLSGKNVRLRSTVPSDSAVRAATVIDGASGGSVITFAGTETAACIVEGFTITNGRALLGGGITGNHASPTIRFCNIVGNNAVGDYAGGGGVARINGIVEDCLVSSNTASSRGGGASECGNGTFRRCVVEHNSIEPASYQSQHCGGGLDGIRVVRNCTIRHNYAAYGGGVSFVSVLVDNMITDNSAGLGGGVVDVSDYAGGNTIAGNVAVGTAGGYYASSTTPTFVNNIVWGNTAPDTPDFQTVLPPARSCIGGWSGGGVGNISADPLFVDAAGGDYRLQAGSPCIDAGMLWYEARPPFNAHGGMCRLAGSAMDMGADEYGATTDSDGDLLADAAEAGHLANPALFDTDSDGLADGIEVIRGTSPSTPNTPPGLGVAPVGGIVQRAVFIAFPNETITLEPGVYHENLFLFDTQLTLSGQQPLDPAVVASTVLDGGARHSVLHHYSLLPVQTQLRGLTFTNGYADMGGGVRTYGGLALVHCQLIRNSAREGGGGRLPNSTLEHCLIEGNQAVSGGGLYSGILDGCLITSNTATNNGGGCAYVTAANSIVTSNTAATGGGLTNSQLMNTVVYGNTASVEGGGAHMPYSSFNSIVWNNSAPALPQLGGTVDITYSCIQGGAAGTGNISANPHFVNAPAGDFHILPSSPCVDAGKYSAYVVAQHDFDGIARPYVVYGAGHGDGTGYDMGAFEMHTPPSAVTNGWELFE